MNKYLYKVLLYAAGFIGIINIGGAYVGAQEYQATPCDESQYSAAAQLPGGNLSVYIRAGRKEDALPTKIYYQQFESTNCVEAGTVTTNSKTYEKAGDINLPEGDFLYNVFIKVDGAADKAAGASTPQLIFTATDTMPCDIPTGCQITYKDQKFNLSPKKVSLSSDTARIGVLQPLNDEIKNVLYTVDGKPAYTKPTLEEFNLNYVPDGEHTITRTVVFKDGQSATDSKVIKRGLEGGATYLLISMFYGQSQLLRYVGIVLAFLIFYSIFTFIVRHIAKRRRWKREHFFNPNEHYDVSQVGAKKGITGEESYGQLLRHYKKYLVAGLTLIAGAFLINSYGLTFFTVDGVSMFPTLQDRSKRPLYTLPVTIGKLNKNAYLPARGTIVVVQKDENNLFEAVQPEEKHYVVKRVVGLPNERVVIKDGKIKIYNKENQKGYEPDSEFKWVADLTGSENILMDIKLKDGELFVIGDNRDESIDSRFYGPIQTSQVIGKVF